MATELKITCCAFRPLSDEDDGEPDVDNNGDEPPEGDSEKVLEEETEETSKEESHSGGLDE